MPKVSIIMPTYNRAWIIGRAVQSMLGQTFTDWELLIMDDGSTDNTKEVLAKFEDPRIKIQNLEHKGPGVARNIALDMAQGEMIGYLDSDDLYYPEFLEVMVSELAQPYLMVYCGQNMFLLEGNKLDSKVIGRKIRNVEYNPVKLTHTNYIGINSILHRKEIIDEIGKFDENLETLEDWDLWVRLAMKHPFKIKHVDQTLSAAHYFLKNTASTMTNSYASDETIKKYFGLREGSGDSEKILKKIKSELNLE